MMPQRREPDDFEHWYPTAIVLLCEDRHCTHCAKVHRVPNPELMLRITNPAIPNDNTRLIARSRYGRDLRAVDLPQVIQVERTYAERCHECFAGAPAGQLLLFPTKKPRVPTWAEILAAKRQQIADASSSAGNKQRKTPSKAEAARKRVAELLGDL